MRLNASRRRLEKGSVPVTYTRAIWLIGDQWRVGQFFK